MASQPDAREDIIRADWGLPRTHGRQILPLHVQYGWALLCEVQEVADTSSLKIVISILNYFSGKKF